MIEIVGASPPADLFGIHEVLLIGDGVSSSINISLTKAPFVMNFAGNNPSTLRSFDYIPSISGVTATATLKSTVLSVVLSKPLPQGEIFVIVQAIWSFQ